MPDSSEFKIIDNHVHVAGPGDTQQGLYWHRRFAKGVGFKGLKFLKGWYFKRVTDELMVNALLKQTRTMKGVDCAVILALDNVYEVNGTCRGPGIDSNKKIFTTLFVSNEFVKNLCEQPGNSNLLFGLSVHPYRNDAIEQLEKYHENAVLCKWLPSAQMIKFDRYDNQSEEKLNKFYDKLAELKLPLLIHTGEEESIPTAENNDYWQKFNNTLGVEIALDKGVAVILAHCGCSYRDRKIPTDVNEEVIELFKKKEEQNRPWKLYADISAVYSLYRKRKILDQVFKNLKPEYLIYGSDWPNPAVTPKWRLIPGLKQIFRYARTNLLSKYLKIARKDLSRYYPHGTHEKIFTNFHELLNNLGRGHLI